MKFYINSYGEEMDKEKFIGLQSLIKYNQGKFKSEKQAKFISFKWTKDNKDLESQGHWVREWVKDYNPKLKYITVDGYTEYGHGHGLGHVRIEYLYEIDQLGVTKRYRLRFKRTGHGGTSIKSVEVDWTADREIKPFK